MQYAESLWMDEFRCLTFDFEGREATLIFPREETRTDKWLLKTEYFHAFQDFELALVRRGFHLVYLKNINRWGLDADQDAKARLRDFLHAEFSLSRTCVPVGMSCGGLHALRLAARHPDMVSVMYLDAPVVDLRSFPLGLCGKGAPDAQITDEMLSALSLTREEAVAWPDNPRDCFAALTAARIPLLLVWGDADEIVHWEENALPLAEAYRAAGVPLLCMPMPGRGHHPHGPADPDAAIEFILTHA